MQPTQTSARAQQSGIGIKYASPRDLPSYPSLGLKKSDSAASAAATLGRAFQRTSESSKPSNPFTPAAASTAALLAHGNRMRSNSELSDKPADSLKAATLATKSSTTSSSRREQPANLITMSSSAATQAFRASPKLSPRDSQFPGAGRRGPPANGVMSTFPTRPRAQSSPLSRDSTLDQRNAALSAATLAHRPSIRSQHTTLESGAIPYTTLPRSMFTATPPLKTEAEDQKKNDELHASAVAMARRMYTQQQTIIDATKKAHGIEPSRTPAQPMPSLQETAYKLAQERVAKLNSGDRQSREHHEYYGASSPIQRCFSTRSLLRPRASSDSDAMDDRRQSRHIRQQMSLFNNKLGEIDEQKQDADRQALLAVAQKNVKARLADIDSKIQTNTSRVRSVSNEWQVKAQAAARLKSEERSGGGHPDQVDIGGGKYMNMKDVEAIASKRMEPVLAEINRKAEEERIRLAQLQAEQEAKKQEAAEKKAKEREIKEANRQQKEREKQAERGRKEKEKQEERERREIGKREERERREAQKQEERQRKEKERVKKEEEKATKAEFKRQAKEEKRRNKELAAAARATEKLRRQHEGQQTQQSTDHNNHGVESDTDSDGTSLLSSRPSTPMSTDSHHQTPKEGHSASPTSPKAKMKTWFKHRFSRSRAESSIVEEEDRAKDSSFVGGAALSRSNNSLPSGGDNSMRDVAAGERRSEIQRPQFLGERQSEVPIAGSVSLLTDEDEDEEFVLAPRSRWESSGSSSEHAQELMSTLGGKAPGAFGPETMTGTGSSLRDSRFREVID